VPRETDQVLARMVAEIEDRQQFIDGVLESAQGEDLDDNKLDLVTRARDRIDFLNKQMGPIEEARRISGESSERIARIARYMQGDQKPVGAVEYRSAGEYAIDMWKSSLGDDAAKERLYRWQNENRAASHQTSADNPGLIPAPIVGPVVNFIDASRPLVSALGPRQLPGLSFSRPKVTQHTSVAAQGGEKTELVSQKMVIGKLAVTPTTYGGYVNVSRRPAGH
jgi:HK97 family phage major capsid protein